jgi:sigma-B regulation protein RsbU (phosphoserine phosphatase)
MATSYQPVNPQPGGRQNSGGRLSRFWQRVTDGLELNQLWDQFRSDARASYGLYSRGIEVDQKDGVRRGRHFWGVAKQFFWAILEKLSPARRVMLLLALVLLLFNPEFNFFTKSGAHIIGFDFRLLGGLLMFTELMPANPPAVPGMEIAFATRPANTVAGDYYDVFARPRQAADVAGGQSYLIAVADVAGKSIPAALLMATFQASLKTLSATASSFAKLVNAMNRYACSNSQNGLRFTTAFIAEYEPGTRTLTYINAGHNQPILRRTSGSIERLDAGGLPLGIKADAPYETATVTLQSGDWLVVFTDGVVEAINEPGVEYGEERLISILHSAADIPPVKMLSRIMVDLDSFVGTTPQQDDITCLVIRIGL